MDILEIGTEVLLDGEIPATITAINVRGKEHRLTYEVMWWDERNRRTEWVDPFEITVKQETKRRELRFIVI